MIISGIDSVDINKIMPGDTVLLQRVSKEMTNKLFEQSRMMGCKLIYLQYGKFYIKDERYINRERIIEELLN